jgi:hypothetical protein
MCAFIGLIGLAIAGDEQQIMIRLMMKTKLMALGDTVDENEAQQMADSACNGIEERLGFIHRIFLHKYMRTQNPLRDAFQGWEHEVGFDKNSADFVMDVTHLVKRNCRPFPQFDLVLC